MDHTITTAGGQTTISMKGRLTFDDQGTFRVMLKDLSDDSAPRWLIDISQLEFLDSAGLGLLLRAQAIADKNQKDVSMKAPSSGHVADILKIAQFDKLIPYA